MVLGGVCPSAPSPQIASRGLERSVVFEDDVRFEAAFPARLRRLMEELDGAQQDWDLMWVMGTWGGGRMGVPRAGSHCSVPPPAATWGGSR